MSILASQYRMLTVLREVESYLIAAKMPLIRKLEFAAELRMARLYDMTMREIGPNAVDEVAVSSSVFFAIREKIPSTRTLVFKVSFCISP